MVENSENKTTVTNAVNVANELTIDDLSKKYSKIREFVEKLSEQYDLINNNNIRADLASTIQAATLAFEKISDPNVKAAARGLALAAIGKLHIEVDKL